MSIAINKFFDYLKFEKGYSELTAKAYLQDLKILFAYTDDIKSLTNEKVQTLLMQQNAKGKSTKSVKRLIASINSYLNYLFTINYLGERLTLDVITPKLAKKLPKSLSYEQIKLMTTQFNDNLNEKRNIAIIAVLYSCGLRVAELVALNKSDIDFKQKFVKVLGKGNKQRYTPIGIYALELLTHYLNANTNSDVAVFNNHKGQRLGVRSVQKIIAERAMLVGIEFNVSPHMLRHAAASHLLQSSGNLRATQEYLGHKSITSTQVYTHLDFQALATVYDKCHPHAKNDKG